MTPDGSIKWPVWRATDKPADYEGMGDWYEWIEDASGETLDNNQVADLLNSIPEKDAEIAGLRERVKELEQEKTSAVAAYLDQCIRLKNLAQETP